jgi:hypothetical protein
MTKKQPTYRPTNTKLDLATLRRLAKALRDAARVFDLASKPPKPSRLLQNR